MPRRIVVATIAALLLSAPAAQALTVQPPRPTALEAHDAIHQVFDLLAWSLDDHGRVVIGRCRPSGRARACPVTVVAHHRRMHFATRTTRDDAESFTFAARYLDR